MALPGLSEILIPRKMALASSSSGTVNPDAKGHTPQRGLPIVDAQSHSRFELACGPVITGRQSSKPAKAASTRLTMSAEDVSRANSRAAM